MYRLSFAAFFFILFSPIVATAQSMSPDAAFIKNIHDNVLTEGKCYDWLNHLCTRIGNRVSGSPQAAAAVEYTRQVMDELDLDSVWLQPCMVPHWVRGEKEQVKIINSPSIGSIELSALSLGNTEGTGSKGLVANVIEVQGIKELEQLGKAKIEGKIVFFNRPMNPTLLSTGQAYGEAVDQRVNGAAAAAKFGAVAVLVRSMTTCHDDHPHTGTCHYEEGVTKIPALAISTKSADLLSDLIKNEPVRVYIRNTSKMMGIVPSYNVIGELRGSQFPNEIIAIGGHLDSWDVGQGAQDDGAGCVQSIEVLRLLKSLNYKPQRTIRAVMFMNEENGLEGALEYARESNRKNEKHIFSLESDSGAGTPRGITFDADKLVFNDYFEKISSWAPFFDTYGLTLKGGGSGADVGPLKGQKGLLAGYKPDGQRYFDYHHTEADTFDTINKRELELGAAAMAAIVYLIDKHGL